MMDPGWFILFLFLMTEIALITLLVMPMPSNDFRGQVTTFVSKLWHDNQILRYAVYAMLTLDVIYFWFVFDALLHPLYDYGFLRNPVAETGISCEATKAMYANERSAYITGVSLFLFVVLNRLVDIQDKLHQARRIVKETGKEPEVVVPVDAAEKKQQ